MSVPWCRHDRRAEPWLTETNLPAPVPEPSRAEAARTLLAATLKRARWTIFWERLWPALAGFLTAIGVFLALAWLGVFLWLPPLGRAAVTIVCGLLAAAALIPLLRLRLPALRDSLNRLDRDSGLRHRPATAITDDLAVTPKDPYSLALWNAHVERALAAARALKTGWPSPRVSRRDPYALRALVLIACAATFFAAGGERWHRIAVAFDWHGAGGAAGHPSRRDRGAADERHHRGAGEFDAGGALDRQAQPRRYRHGRR